jgi:hypothetical protein
MECPPKSCGAFELMLTDNALVLFSNILDPILKHCAFRRQKPRDLVKARYSFPTKIAYLLPKLIFMVTHNRPPAEAMLV